jgi:surface protein
MAMGLGIGIGIPSGAFNSNSAGGLIPGSFVTTWRTTTPNETITIPTLGSGYNYNITTSDSQTFNGVTGSQAITFTSAGDYDVSISGDFPRIYINNGVDRNKLIDIRQWGNIVWSSFNSAFEGCSNLTGSYTDVANTSNVTSMRDMFKFATVFNSALNFDTSNVTDMSSMFAFALAFSQDISGWDVSSLVFADFTFNRATLFNADISSWDVSNVTRMGYLFADASSFNRDLGNWDINQVSQMPQFLRNVTLSTANYDSTLIGWASQIPLTYNGTLSFGNSTYTPGGSAESARTALINDVGAIVDGGAA